MFLRRAAPSALLLLAACAADDPAKSAGTESTGSEPACSVVDGRPAGWSDASHGKDVAPDYDLVLGGDAPHRIDITLAAADLEAEYAELATLIGSGFGEGGGDTMVPDEEMLETLAAACEGLAAGDACSASAMGMEFDGTCTEYGGDLLCVPDDLGGMGGDVDMTDLAGDPSYMDATVMVDGATWCHAGMRMKGNSTLIWAWQTGVGKLPFRLDFDRFSDDNPDIDGQRFHGFEELSFGNGYGDPTLLRDRVAQEALDTMGVPAARVAFYQVFVDAGEGSTYWGLYSAIEDPSDVMMDRVFGDDDGNLYKPSGTCADLTCFDEESFEKKSNDDEADWTDVEAFVAALNADRTDGAAWRDGLEATFAVDEFLQWLAVNAAMGNWDTYGGMAHNYYLYAPPEDGRLHWIPWDHNLAFEDAIFGDITPLYSDTDETWPLIRHLLDDEEYGARYEGYLADASATALVDADFAARADELAAATADARFGPDGEVEGYTFLTTEAEYDDALAVGLIQWTADRQALIRETLGE